MNLEKNMRNIFGHAFLLPLETETRLGSCSINSLQGKLILPAAHCSQS